MAVWPTVSNAETGQHTLFCSDCASQSIIRRQRNQDTEEAALKSRLEELGAEALAAAAASVRFEHLRESASTGGEPEAAASTPVQYAHSRTAARPTSAANMRARRRADNHEREAARAWHSPPPAYKAAAQRRGDEAASAGGVPVAALPTPAT